MKDEIFSYMLDAKNFSPTFLVIEEHAHYMKMCIIETFIHIVNDGNWVYHSGNQIKLVWFFFNFLVSNGLISFKLLP